MACTASHGHLHAVLGVAEMCELVGWAPNNQAASGSVGVTGAGVVGSVSALRKKPGRKSVKGKCPAHAVLYYHILPERERNVNPLFVDFVPTPL
jgi:hypothetical protein